MKLLRRIFKFKRMYLLLAFPLGLMLTAAARLSQGWVEYFYMRHIHAFLENTLGRLVSSVPFSISEWLIVFALLGVLTYIGFVIAWICKNKSAWKGILYRAGINLLCVGSLIYLAFVLTMGLCYYRTPAVEYLNLSPRKYSVEELAEVTQWLADSANEQRALLAEDKNGVSVLTQTDWWDVSAEAQRCFNAISETHPEIGTTTARNKPMVFSGVMSRVMTMGVYMPLTLESNINVDMTAYTVPATMCHELSHVKGFMREDEASFLGFLACMQSDRPDFLYSGYMSAFGYALNRLADEDYQAAVKVAQSVSDGVRADDDADHKFWMQYRDTVIADASGEIYDAYLQSNNQTDGLKSYGKMLDLVICWYQSEVKGK